MAISTAQWVDLLVKKLFGVAKTAPESEKSPSNESIASPAFIRGDVVWIQSNQITSSAGAISGIANARTGTSAVQCTGDNTASNISGTYQTWKSNVTYWIPQEFGATWLPKVYVGAPGAANIEATGTQIFAAGSGGTGEYYFDTQAGVLNFIGGTIPTVLSGNVSNVVYISGYQYVGALGIQNIPANIVLGNLTVTNTTIGTSTSNANIVIDPNGTGLAVIDTTTGLVIPVGNTAQQPSPATTGTIRFNTTSSLVEVYDGSAWSAVGGATVTNQVIVPDGTSVAYTLDRSTTAASIIVSINGLVQIPGASYSYTVSGTTITFAQAPEITDIIDIRFL